MTIVTGFAGDYGDSITAARRHFLRTRRGPVQTCPVCMQEVKEYPRALHSTIARWLINLVRRYEQEPRWYAVKEPWSLAIGSGTGDTAKLQVWGLIDHKPKDPEQRGRQSGFWKPTDKGIAFVYRRIRVPSRYWAYSGGVVTWDDEPTMVSIDECLGKHFDYEQMMQEFS